MVLNFESAVFVYNSNDHTSGRVANSLHALTSARRNFKKGSFASRGVSLQRVDHL